MIHLTAKVDNEQAKRKFKELETSARNSIRGIETESKGMERSMGNLAKGIAAIGGAAAMTGLVKKMVEVRGEFQQLGIAFETMLGSKEKADNLMREAVAFAAKTPFTLTDVASNIKQLMAMGVAVENVMDTMKMLGDVAAGVSVPISRVAINYGQVLTMGKLQGRELRDFAMAGIPLVDELAKNLGVAKDEVQDLVSAGRVMADDVTEAFRTMSAEGGRFYNLMEKQNKSVTGQIANLKDRIEVMFNEMGTASEGAIYGVIKGAQYLVEHYKGIADILVPLIATFGAYKVALIAVAAAQRAVVSAKSISAFFSLAKSIHSAKDAMLLLNMSMNANTIGLVVAAIAALATTTTILIRRANDAAEAANRAKKAFKEETAGLRSLIEILNDSNMAYEERKRALDKIRDMVPDYHASLTQEGQLINNNTAAIDKYLESLEKEILMKTLYDDLEQAIQKRENLKDGSFLLSLIGVTGGKKAQQRIVDEAVAAVEDIKEKIKTASKGEDASILGPFLPEGFDRELGRIKEAGDLIKQARKNVSDLAGELERVKTNPQQYENAQKWAAAIKEAEENLKDAQDTLDTLTGGLLGGPVGLIAKIKEVISALNEKKDAATSITEIAAINDEIAALEQLKEGYEKVSAAMLEMSKTPIPSVTGGDVTGKVTTTKQQGVDIDALTKKYVKQKKEVQEIEKSFMRITDAIYRITYSGLELGEMLGLDPDLIRGFNALIGSVLDMVDAANLLQDALDGVAKGGSDTADAMADASASVGNASMGIVSAFFAIASAMLKIGTAIADMKNAREDAKIEAYIDDVNKRLETLQRNLENIANITGIGDSWFTEDNFNNVRMLVDSINEAIIGAQQFADAMEQSFIGVPDMIKANETFKALQRGYAELRAKLDMKGLRFDVTEIDNLIELAEQFKGSGKLAEQAAADVEAFIQAMKEAKKYYDELGSLIESMMSNVSSGLLSTVNSVWKEFRNKGVDAIGEVTRAAKKSIAEIIDQMVSQQIWAETIAPYFTQLGEDLTNAIAVGGDLMDVFDSFWVGMEQGLFDYTALYEKFLSSAESRGWDMGGEKTQDPAKDSIKAMREELAKLQEQWDNLKAEQREGDLGKQLFGYIKDLEAKIKAAESLYDVMTDIEGSINDLNNKLSELNEQWNALSPEDREGAIGQGIKADIAFYENLLDEAQGVQQSELEKLKALIYSSAAKNSLYKKWIELYGDEIATQMMGEMLGDAQGYVDNLRSGIAELTAKVTAGTATDEEIAQLEAWEQQLQDIMNSGAAAAKQAASEAYQSWNDALNTALEGAGTQYEKMAVLQNEYLSALENYEGLDAGPMKDAAREYLDYLEGLLKDQSTLIENDLRDRYKTQEQANAETLKTFEDDLEYAREVLQDEDLAKEIERQRDEFLSEQAAAALEASEDYKLIFGDLTNISEEAFKDAMGKIKKSIEESTDLTDEAKAEILKNLDAIGAGFNDSLGEKRINKIKQSFDDLVSVMNDTVSLMQSLGAGDSAVQMLQGVVKVVEGYRDLKLAIEEAALAQTALSLSNVFTSIVAVINGLIMALSALGVKLVQLVDVDSISGLAEAYDKLTDAISRSVGAQRLQKQEAARQNLEQQKAEVERALAREKAKWGFTLNLGIFGKYQILGPDKGVVKEMEAQIADLNKALDQLGDTMKQDYLQTDAMSFSSDLANILTSQYDSYADMMADVEKLTQKTLNNITRQWLTAHFLEESIQDALDALYGGGKEPTAQAYEAFQRKVNEASENFMREMDRMNLMFGSGETTSGTSNAGVISRSITENTATWIKGLMMNQNLELNEMNKNIQYIGKFSERTANGVEDLTRINSQIAQHTSVLPKMAQGIISLAADVSVIKGKVGISRENL